MTTRLPPLDLIDQLISSLNQMAAKGWRGFDCSPQNLALISRWSEIGKIASPPDSLMRINAELNQCQRCILWQSRTHIVFGTGNRNADLVFVGDRLEDEDDQTAEPFSGPAGELLTRIIAAMKLKREDVYLCNLVKCAPPKHRLPLASEVNACTPFLRRQLAVIAPNIICSLGELATQVLLNTEQSFFDLRGHFHDLDGIKVMPTYHPAELLRHPERKRETWTDIQKVMHALGLPIG